MKLRSLILGLCVSLCSTVFAANQHLHPQSDKTDSKSLAAQKMGYPSYCEIEIVNNSFENITVYGTFDDGFSMSPFNVYSFESAHYISLYYYGYCHSGMSLYIDTWSGYHIYSGYTPTGSTIRVLPYLGKQVKAEVIKK
jgi:hypothetical protein